MRNRDREEEQRHELKLAREQGFFDRSAGVCLFITSGFILCLFLFLHFREVRVEVLELGSIAQRYIVAQVDFDFFDEEATIILRQEAVRDIGKIYQIRDKDIRQRRLEFENYLIYNQDWRKQAEQSTFEEMYKGVDLLEKNLLQLRLTDPRTLQKMKELNLSTKEYQVYTPNDTAEEVLFPEQVWATVRQLAFGESGVQEGTIAFVLAFFNNRRWKLEEDIVAQRVLRKKVQGEVPDKYTSVSAGSRIIDQGEKITTRHVAILQAMKRTLGDKRNLWHPITLSGSLIMSMLLTVVAAAYLRVNHPDIMASNRKLFLVATVAIVTLVLSKIFEFAVVSATTNFADFVRYPLFAPFVAILLCSLMNPGVATFMSVLVTVILTMTLALDSHGFLITNILAALVAVLSTRSLRRRKEIFVVCGQAWLSCAVAIFSFHLYENNPLDVHLLADLFSSCVFMLFTAVLVVGVLPLLESAFGIVTDVTLMEYMDPNHELLRRLSIEAPGTYQHSMVVGNLAECAALTIGANGLFCRVSTLYHDIGKLMTPQYFTENQQGGMNIHQLLTPLESAKVIIAHVAEGVAMARKAGLPEQVIDIIKEHHGTTLAYYFYRKQLEQVGGDKSLVDEKDFRYTGPRPRSKESAIIMIADSLEAASRSLDEVNEETLTRLVDKLVREKAEDGQFDQCLLTFEELGFVKKAMVKALVAAGHSRIKYPTREKGPETGDAAIGYSA